MTTSRPTDGDGKGAYRLVRTLRIRNENVPGLLGTWATAIGNSGGNIGNVETIQVGHRYVVRDVDVYVQDQNHLERVLAVLSDIASLSVLEVRDEVLDLHRGGKIETVGRHHVTSVDQLGKVYTPGVADVSRRIKTNADEHRLYTSIPNTIAIATDGSAVLGLGNVGQLASMPVMEGKALLLQEFVGLSGVPLLLDTNDPAPIVETIKHVSLTFGGVQLEDISAPRCFEIFRRLDEELAIPVMHDDRHGTAAVALAAVIRACGLAEIPLGEVSIGQIGLGAAGMGIVETVQHYTGCRVLGTDISEERLTHLEAEGGIPATLAEVMAKAGLVIATTGAKDLIPPDLVRPGQIILALSNPEPEILPAVALERGAALAVDGRAVNNLLGFPGIWRGAVDCWARTINRDMLIAAALALSTMSTSSADLLPSPLNRETHVRVAQAIVEAAVATGSARQEVDEDYFTAVV